MATNPNYIAAAARADKMLEPDGSIQTHSGTVVSGPNPALATAYSNATARADKLLQPDGSITTSGSGTGGSTPPGGVSGQVQYNNAGVFAGAPILTDGTNVTVGESAVVAAPFAVGAGTNTWLTINPPGGTFNSTLYIRPGGTSGAAYIQSQSGPLMLSPSASSYVRIAYPSGVLGLDVTCNGNSVNGFAMVGSAAGAAPVLSVQGSDTNLGLTIQSKGTSAISLQPGPGVNNFVFQSYGMYYFNAAEANPRAFIGSAAGVSLVQLNNAATQTAAVAGAALQCPSGTTRTISLFTSNATSLVERLRVDGNGVITCYNVILTPVYTVATLPAATAAIQGARALVTDATAPTFLGTLTGGGSVICPVFCNGTAWIAG